MPDDRTCVAWGTLRVDEGQYTHMDCPVILTDARSAAVKVVGPLPQVCPCECQTCKRAWWAQGRPKVKNGEITRARSY